MVKVDDFVLVVACGDGMGWGSAFPRNSPAAKQQGLAVVLPLPVNATPFGRLSVMGAVVNISHKR